MKTNKDYMLNNNNKFYNNNTIKLHYLCIIELLYKFNGINGLSYKWLIDNEHKRLYNKIVISYKLKLENLSINFNCNNEWKNNRKIKFCDTINKIIWNETIFNEKCIEIINKYGYIPSAEFLRNNRYNSFINYLYNNNYSYEKLNEKFNIEYCPKFTSRNGLKFKSLAETCLANFLYSRGIEIKVGEKYPENYNILSGQKYGVYNIHFKGKINQYKDKWIDCEVWGGKSKWT
jgi:hypothetical protein